jgi:hypothetical protein
MTFLLPVVFFALYVFVAHTFFAVQIISHEYVRGSGAGISRDKGLVKQHQAGVD